MAWTICPTCRLPIQPRAGRCPECASWLVHRGAAWLPLGVVGALLAYWAFRRVSSAA